MIKAIIGLGNPGTTYYKNRHSIGFRVLDALVEQYGGTWQHKELADTATIVVNGHEVILVKPQTYMNSSGKVIPALLKRGIKPAEILVVHDELEVPFGQVKMRIGGSHRGHNGLRSIIESCGPEFARIRFGIGRPAHKEDVPHYVLHNFSSEEESGIDAIIAKAIALVADACR